MPDGSVASNIEVWPEHLDRKIPFYGGPPTVTMIQWIRTHPMNLQVCEGPTHRVNNNNNNELFDRDFPICIFLEHLKNAGSVIHHFDCIRLSDDFHCSLVRDGLLLLCNTKKCPMLFYR